MMSRISDFAVRARNALVDAHEQIDSLQRQVPRAAPSGCWVGAAAAPCPKAPPVPGPRTAPGAIAVAVRHRWTGARSADPAARPPAALRLPSLGRAPQPARVHLARNPPPVPENPLRQPRARASAPAPRAWRAFRPSPSGRRPGRAVPNAD